MSARLPFYARLKKYFITQASAFDFRVRFFVYLFALVRVLFVFRKKRRSISFNGKLQTFDNILTERKK